jgi:excisionase family DNA binding protein
MPRISKDREPQKRVVYKVNEVAAMLGINRKTVYVWVKKGILRGVPVPGGTQMIDARSVDALIEGKAETILIEAKNTKKGQGVGQPPKKPK